MNPIIIIPARMNASRFYGKPLQLINNLPMVVKIMKQAEKANICRVVVATPDKEIADTIKNYKGEVVLTSNSCNTGTDRIAEAIKILDSNYNYDIVINLQGDLAVFENEVIEATLSALSKNINNYDIATACTLITNQNLINNPNTVKAVVSFFNHSKTGRALYFTRSTCPYGQGELYQHLGIYAYTRYALEKFVSAEKSPLEVRENLEQLRALELGLKIIITKVNSIPKEVNTQDDLEDILKMHPN